MDEDELSLADVLNLPDDDGNFDDILDDNTDPMMPPAVPTAPVAPQSSEVEFVVSDVEDNMVGLNQGNIYRELEGVVSYGKSMMDKLNYMIECQPDKGGVYAEAATFINSFNKTIEHFTKIQDGAQNHQRKIELAEIKHKHKMAEIKARGILKKPAGAPGEDVPEENIEWSMENFLEEEDGSVESVGGQ